MVRCLTSFYQPNRDDEICFTARLSAKPLIWKCVLLAYWLIQSGMTVWLLFHGKNADKSVEWPWHNPLKKLQYAFRNICKYLMVLHSSAHFSYPWVLALTKFEGFIMIVINDRKVTGLLTPYKDSSSEAQLFWQSRARKIAEDMWTYHRGSPKQPNQCLKKVISTHKDTGGCQGLMENISK